jgi:ATP-binding cassette subfamily B protein
MTMAEMQAACARLFVDGGMRTLLAADPAAAHDALAPWFGQRSVVLVTHRLTKLRDVGHILVLAGGVVEAEDGHDELLAASPTYAAMYRAGERALVDEG